MTDCKLLDNKSDYAKFKQFYRDTIQQISEDSFYRRAVNHKFVHSIEVLHTGEKILRNTPELQNMSDEFCDYARKALLFHDVGRFRENLLRYQADLCEQKISAVSDVFDHCVLGYEVLKQVQEYNDLRILFAVRYHGKMMEDVKKSEMWQMVEKSSQKEDILNILYLVRDADKLANLLHIKNDGHLKKDLFYKQLSQPNRNGSLSDEVKAQFYDKKTILFSTVQTYADRVLMVLSWVFDFNYRYAVKVFYENGYGKFLFDELQQYHSDSADIKRVERILQSEFAGH